MNLNKLVLLSLLFVSGVLADGLLMSNDEDYPADFLRHRASIIDVDIQELYATTTVYQEFVNDWAETTDAVWSFPLPFDARSVRLRYTRNDTIFQAILIESAQSTNPGTGEGGVAALVNDYIGFNGLRLQLLGIAPGAIQKVELTYISLVDYFQGQVRYKYPLRTDDFTDYPVEHLELNIHILSDRDISAFNMETHPNYEYSLESNNELSLSMMQPMAFLNRDIKFSYTLANETFGRDFFSALNTQVAGHFAFFLTPPNFMDAAEILNRKLVFVVSNSTSMAGYKLEASVAAIKLGLDELDPSDYFNILSYNNTIGFWRSVLVPASLTNINSAKIYLDGLTAAGGNHLDYALNAALQQFNDSDYHNAILAFTDGRSPLDPVSLAAGNVQGVAIFPVAIGSNVDHSRLDMTARLNKGFVTYLNEESNLISEMGRVISVINKPVFNDVAIDFNKPDVHDVLPEDPPNTYAGLYSLFTGRYLEAGTANMGYWGDGVAGSQQYGFNLEFSQDTTEWGLAAYLWAQRAIDALDQQIDIYGETETLKDSSIALSLRYQMRCRYTAYYADYELVVPIVVNDALRVLPKVSYLVMAYPNPFNPATTFHLVIGLDQAATPLVLNIYDLRGRLVDTLDLSRLGPGHHHIPWLARGANGEKLASGVYFAVLVSDGFQGKPMKILLLK